MNNFQIIAIADEKDRRKFFVASYLNQINYTLKLLSQKIHVTEMDLLTISRCSRIFLALGERLGEKQVVGFALITPHVVPSRKICLLDDLVVDLDWRHQGVGRELFYKCAKTAKRVYRAKYLEFTSRPERAETQKFYEGLGCKPRDTNVFRYVL